MSSDLIAEKRLQTLQVASAVVLIIAATTGFFFLTQQKRVAFHSAEKAYSRGDYTAAAAAYEAAGEFALRTPASRGRAAHAWQASGRLEQALGAYRDFLRDNPRDPSAITAYAGITQALGRPADGLAAYKVLGPRESLDDAQLAHLADIYQQAGLYDDAIAVCRLVLQRRPDARPVRLLLARVLSWTGRLEESATEYRLYLRE